MKKILMILSLVVIALFLFGCTEISSEELEEELDGLSEDELDAVMTEDETALAGQAYKKVSSKAAKAKKVWISCSDSDGGKNYEQKGDVTYTYEYRGKESTRTSVDRCKGDTLYEYYCEGNRFKYERNSCDTGCEDGACVVEEVVTNIISNNTNQTSNDINQTSNNIDQASNNINQASNNTNSS